MRVTRAVLRGLGATAMVVALAGVAVGKNEKTGTALVPTGVVPGAKGFAKLMVRHGSDGTFDVKVQKLARRTHYAVVVGGVAVGDVTTSNGGNARVRFRSAPHRKDLPLGFDPRGAGIAVRDDAGDDVLTGDVPDQGGPDSAAAAICCTADDDHEGGVECGRRPADKCTAHGGTVSTATSCLPNPCGDSAAGAFTACCKMDDDEAECELKTATACASRHGVAVQATSCDPNPCTTTTPPPGGGGDDDGGGHGHGHDHGHGQSGESHGHGHGHDGGGD